MSATPIDLSRLPAPDVVEQLDYETLLAARKARLIALYPPAQQAEVRATLELESEPMLVLLQESAYREIVLRQRINDAARAVMLAYATGHDLEQLAAFFGIERLVLSPANPEQGIPVVMESDADLRKRTQLAPQGYSVAGPEGAYISHALNTDGRVLDASATSPAPCEVLVTILSRDGDGTADARLVDAVAAALKADNVRPLTDRVTVQSAQIVPYKVNATLYTFPGPDSSVVLAEARARLARYVAESHRLGREITLSGVYATLHVEGVERVQLDEPAANVAVNRTQAPYCVDATVRHGGIYG
jgi:phage-related baseplate assembly protein